MNYYQELKKYLNNNLFTSYSLEIDFPKIYNFNANQKAFRDILTKITKIYDKNKFIKQNEHQFEDEFISCLLYTSPSPRDRTRYRMPSSA
ncbi:hypothetical protein Y869_09505 [Campylobacter jejuni CVM 41921]|nr:hypothetical protein Y869_09505 [Campylobacter jejuni CVM 41921]